MHVTVQPPFDASEPRDLAIAVGRAVVSFPAFSLRTEAAEVISDGEYSTIILPIEECPPFEDLRGRLARAVAPVVATLGTARGRVTIATRIPRDRVDEALRAVTGWRANYSWIVRDIDLIEKREGAPWQFIERFSFGRP